MSDFYNKKVFFRLMDFSLSQKKIGRLRQELLSNANGKVLEIGFGTGLNLSWYPGSIASITAIDVNLVDHHCTSTKIQVDLLKMSAEAMSFPDESFDTVVSTFTLCSIPDIHGALKEIKRVLKPDGIFLFLEHGKSPNGLITTFQNLLNPFYNLLANGCNVNRDMVKLIKNNGMNIQSLRTTGSQYLLAGYIISGIANAIGAPC